MRKLLLLLCIISTFVSANELTDLLERVQVEPVEMDFELEIYWSIREKTESKDGELLIRGDEEFNFTLDNSQWVSDGVTAWQYSENNSQVIIKNFFDLSHSLHPSTIFDRFADRDFNIATVDNEEIWSWTGTDDQDYSRIDVKLSEDGSAFELVIFVDTDENISTYEFGDFEFLENVDDSRFVFSIPEGVEVFDER